jgi:hypothetical protein
MRKVTTLIIGITDDANSQAFRATDSLEGNGLMVESLSGPNQVWVQYGNLVGPNAGAAFVNVGDTEGNLNGEIQYACDGGIVGEQMWAGLSTASGGCDWHIVT